MINGQLHKVRGGAIKKKQPKLTSRKVHTYSMSILWADAVSDFQKLAEGSLDACYDLGHSLFQVIVFLKNKTQLMTESLRKQLLFYLSQIFGNIALRYEDAGEREIVLSLQREVINSMDIPNVLYYLPEACQTMHNIRHQENTQRARNIGQSMEALMPAVGRLYSRDMNDLSSLKNIHSDEHIQNLMQMPRHNKAFAKTLGTLDINGSSIKYPNVNKADIPYAKDTLPAILATLGAAHDAVERTRTNLKTNHPIGERIFLVVRPPSHHAHHEHPEGFCFTSTLVYAASKLIEDKYKVLIVDFDVHHGNGTYQQLKYLHAKNLGGYYHFIDVYSESSYIRNAPNRPDVGYERNMNFYPLPFGFTGKQVLDSIKTGIEEMKNRSDRFKPDVILVSAGFDAVAEDRYGGTLVPQDYGAIGQLLGSTCSHMVSFLEGGYDLTALPQSVKHYVIGTGGLANQPEQSSLKEALSFLYTTVKPAIDRNDQQKASQILNNNRR